MNSRALSLFPGAELSRVGLQLPHDISFERWQLIGNELRTIEGSVMWWVGDWWAFGEHRYGDRKAAIEAIGAEFQTSMDAAWVARRFETSRRREVLSWSHHKEVAALDAIDADRFLDDAERYGWSRNKLRNQVNKFKAGRRFLKINGPSGALCTFDDLHWLVASGKRFGNIYADPPWLYDNQGTRAATGNHYEGMTVEALCDPRLMPIANLAAEAAHLHLWTTNAFLFDCKQIIEAWGFEFRSSFVWVKTQLGIGNYWRNSHEILLTAVRGDAKRFDDHTLKSWLECERGVHSDKPDQVRSFIERASPTPRFELFGRRQTSGWLVWGNQIERTLFDKQISEVA